jgi:hypothetical protein
VAVSAMLVLEDMRTDRPLDLTRVRVHRDHGLSIVPKKDGIAIS